MTALILHQQRGPLGRSIYSVGVATPEELLAVLVPAKVARHHFVLFLAWDARTTADETVLEFARALLRGGLSYIVAWGPDCERIHDIFDDADILENPASNEADTESVVMSTWHANEQVEEALWFAVNAAYPAAPYDTTTISTIAAVIANEDWTKDVQGYLSDLSTLDRAVAYERPP